MKKLGFGFMRLPLLNGKDPTSFDRSQICEMVDRYLAAGFTYFDTAYMYHNGKSEEMLKEALVQRHLRSSYRIADKLPTMFLRKKEDVPRIFGEQLARTGAGYFDNYLLHCLDEKNYEIAQQLDCFSFGLQKKAEGKIRRFGFSFHDSAALLDRILTEHPEAEFVQLQINYLDWENPSVQSRANYEVARKHGKQIVIMEPVKGGVLANPPKEVQDLFKAYHPDLSCASWAIRFAAGLDGVLAVLSGMSTIEQMKDNISYMKDFAPLNDEEQKIIQKAQALLGKSSAVACTACQYCVSGCPKQIPIPDIFAAMNKQLANGQRKEAELAYAAAVEGKGKASDCIVCRKCETTCPQHLLITDHLKKAAELFE